MSKKLEDMTMEELWQLFPIELAPHNPMWEQWADNEITHLQHLLSGFHPVFNHIGSTAIPAIMAKPIIDILVEIIPEENRHQIREIMERSGYICMAQTKSRMSFNKGYTPTGYADKVFHIHFHETGDNSEIGFRDFLTSHPDIAHEYEALKLSLLPKFKYNRDGYTEAKTEFVEKINKQLRP